MVCEDSPRACLVANAAAAIQLKMYESLYGFSGIVALVGSNANSDSGLAVVHETQNATSVSAWRQ